MDDPLFFRIYHHEEEEENDNVFNPTEEDDDSLFVKYMHSTKPTQPLFDWFEDDSKSNHTSTTSSGRKFVSAIDHARIILSLVLSIEEQPVEALNKLNTLLDERVVEKVNNIRKKVRLFIATIHIYLIFFLIDDSLDLETIQKANPTNQR